MIAGVLVAVMCAVLAFFVVLRRMAFAGAGIPHAALGVCGCSGLGKLVGIVLVSALLVIPAAIGQRVARLMMGMLVVSVAAA